MRSDNTGLIFDSIVADTKARLQHACVGSSGPAVSPDARSDDSKKELSFLRRDRGVPLLTQVAEHFERIVEKNRDLEGRLKTALNEQAELKQTYDRLGDEFERERTRLTLEVTNLRAQLSGRLDSLLGVKERLIRDEYEKKFQELTVLVRQERSKHGRLVAEMKAQLSNCICHPHR